MHVHPPKTNHHTISYRSFRNFDEAKFIEDIQSVPWDTIKLFDDTDDILEAWLDLFLQVVIKHVPIKQHRVKHKNQPQWMSHEILDAMKCRDRYKSLGNEENYKIWRNKVIKLIQNAKKEQYQTFIENNCLHSLIYIISSFYVQSFLVSGWPGQAGTCGLAGLCMTWSETQTTGSLMTSHISSHLTELYIYLFIFFVA